MPKLQSTDYQVLAYKAEIYFLKALRQVDSSYFQDDGAIIKHTRALKSIN